MENKLKILVIIGTVREGRNGKKIGDWYFEEVTKSFPDIEFKLLDAKKANLPLFNEAFPPVYHKYSEIQNKLAQEISWADGFVFVTGEYNHSIPGSLKNLLDYVYLEWNRKAAAFVGYGGSGAIRAIEHMIGVLNFLGIVAVKEQVSINSVWEAFDENGKPKKENIRGSIMDQIKELAWWAKALMRAREEK